MLRMQPVQQVQRQEQRMRQRQEQQQRVQQQEQRLLLFYRKQPGQQQRSQLPK